MSSTIQIKRVEDYIAELSRRIDRLEAGGKPMAGISPIGKVSFTLASGAFEDDIAATLAWSNPDVLANPKGTPQFSIYVDTDEDENYAWPYGLSLNAGQKDLEFDWFLNANFAVGNTNKNRVTFSLKNRDSNSHTYHIYINWLYLTGGSGVET